MRLPAKNLTALLVGLLLGAWIFWLRWPSFDRLAWNMDEGIHASIARTILDGGVMYRDAIDLRTPLTYYLIAGFFWIVGPYNMWAVHALLAGMIAATAFGVYLLGRRWRGPAAGLWSALVFSALSTNLFYIGDSYSLCTEWFVILFTTWSAWWLWRTWVDDSLWKSAVAGAGFAAAFLSKQPGLLDFGAPLATVIFAAATGQLRGADARRRLIGLAAGFTGLTAVVFAYFRAHGALDDLYYYAWAYNLVYYGPETSLNDRILAAIEAFKIVWQHYPLICAALVASAFALSIRVVQLQATAEEKKLTPAAFYLLAWALLALAGAASAGRIYGHYYLQFLPAFSLLAGWLCADCHSWWHTGRNKFLRLAAGAVLVATAWTVVAGPLRGPWPATLGPEPVTEDAIYVRAQTKPGDKIFVWGFSPEFYLWANRPAASRYVYCSFQTGLLPWTNIQPELDTSYAIVPGAMDILLEELATNRPEYIIDTSLGLSRHFTKYPLAKFPRLAAFVAANYLEVEPERFRPYGSRVLMLKNSSRRPQPTPTGNSSDGTTREPEVIGPGIADPGPVEYQVQASYPTARLQRLELLVDDLPVGRRDFDTTTTMTAGFVVHFEQLGTGWHRLVARATLSGGETRTGQTLAVECSPPSLPAEGRTVFAIPLITPGLPSARILPDRVVSEFGAEVTQDGGEKYYFAHAPSVITYPLTPGITRLRGRFGFRPGAYAIGNAGATDGAEFVVSWVEAGGRRRELLRRWLRPSQEPADRGELSLDLTLPATAGGTLELTTTPGPAGNTASDWTYWAGLELSTDR